MRVILAAALTLVAGAAQAATCDAARPTGPHLERVGQHRPVPLYFSMLWGSSPQAPRAASVACFPDARGPRVQKIATHPARRTVRGEGR